MAAGCEMIETEWETGVTRRLVETVPVPKAGEVRLEVTNGSSAVPITRDSLSVPAVLPPRFASVKGGPLNTATVSSKLTTAQAAAQERACLAARVAADNKGRDVIVLDMRQVTPLYDYFVLATGNSRRQIHTMAEEIDAALRAEGDRRLTIEGYEASRWVVQDYGDVVVHLFDSDARQYYALEELWADAERVDWEIH
jgi:ribosome-associated protein